MSTMKIAIVTFFLAIAATLAMDDAQYLGSELLEALTLDEEVCIEITLKSCMTS